MLAWIAGIVSVLATLVSAANSQARMLFDGGRSGLLPAWFGRVRPRVRDAGQCAAGMGAVGLGIIGVWWSLHVVGADTGSTNPVGLYAECSTMGTIVILFVYFLTTRLAPRLHVAPAPASRSRACGTCAIPALGALTLIIPFVELFKPGQPAPYSEFPYMALAIVAAAMVIAWITVRRHPATGASEGATFAEP